MHLKIQQMVIKFNVDMLTKSTFTGTSKSLGYPAHAAAQTSS